MACSDEKPDVSPPLGDHTGWIFFETFDPEIVCDNSAVVWGLIDGPAGELIEDYGHCWDTYQPLIQRILTLHMEARMVKIIFQATPYKPEIFNKILLQDIPYRPGSSYVWRYP